jgi:hypothetical protein
MVSEIYSKNYSALISFNKENIWALGLWQWCINITIKIVDIIHHPVFYLTQNFREWILPQSSGGTDSVLANWQSYSLFADSYKGNMGI